MSLCKTTAECYASALDVVNELQNNALYSPSIFPLTGTTEILSVTSFFFFYKLINLNNDKTLTVALEIDLQWLDPNIPANWSAFPNETQLFVQASQVWTMNMYLMNSASAGSIYLEPNDLVFMFPTEDGSKGAIVQENIVNEFTLVCESMNLVNYPFDSQTCSMSFGYEDLVFPRTNFSLPSQSWVARRPSNEEWHLRNISFDYSADWTSQFNSTDIHNGYLVLFFFDRKSYYYAIFLIVPTVLLLSIALLTVVLPSDRGEKVVLGATILVSLYVLVTDMMQQVPQVEADEMPHIIIALEAGLIMTGVTVLEAVLVQTLRIYSFDMDPLLSCCRKSCCTACKSAKKSGRVIHDGPPDLPANDSHSCGDNPAFSTTESTDVVRLQRVTSSAMVRDESSTVEHRPDKLPDSISLDLLRLLLRDRNNEEREQQRKEAFWRTFEYFLNFITLILCIACITYYLGYYIYSR